MATQVEPRFSRKEVTRAGALLCKDSDASYEDLEWASEVLTNWRAAHNYPINTFQATLRKKLDALSTSRTMQSLVAQRLKRTPSIIAKLERFEGMQLARMQDIGGLRAILPSLAFTRRLHDSYIENKGRFTHDFVNCKDYIAEPKSDGYRSIHQIFRYKNPKAPAYDGLLLELQIRSRMQHSWGTAVETVGAYLNQPLKSGGGHQDYRHFFATCSAAIANREKTAPVPGFEGWTKEDIWLHLADQERHLKVVPKLQAFAVATSNIHTPSRASAAFHLIILDIERRRVRIMPFGHADLERAVALYEQMEREHLADPSIEVVLVTAGPIKMLRKAYPNYFLDTTVFVRYIEPMIDNGRRLARAARRQRPSSRIS